mgnify:CR=1 FL=1|tara:strand:- start:1005 stop:2150 length:1146 start_codon:yes stop_codon:yes gene_type:complete
MIKSKTNKDQKIIKVIDTPFSSFLLERILEGEPNFSEIIEIKKDLRETKLTAKNILKISKKKIFLKSKFVITNSTAIFWSRFKFLNFLKFHKLQKDIFKKICFKKDHIYVGSMTSTILNVVPKSNRIFIDHGFDDYRPKVFKLSNLEKIIDLLKEKINKYIGYPYISFNEKINSYTVCKIPKFTKNFIDMQNLPTNQIVESYFIRIKKDYPRINTIFLLEKNWHTNHYYKRNKEVDYDRINFELIKKYIPKGQKFFIKFHEFSILSNQVSPSFVKKMSSFGYQAVDIDRYLKPCYRGKIPAELLISKLKLKRVISRYSSVLHNISHNTSLDCIMDINPELHEINNNSKYYKTLLTEFNHRYSFNKSIRGKVNIKSIQKQNF